MSTLPAAPSLALSLGAIEIGVLFGSVYVSRLLSVPDSQSSLFMEAIRITLLASVSLRRLILGRPALG
jgi:hypothetical protein